MFQAPCSRDDPYQDQDRIGPEQLDPYPGFQVGFGGVVGVDVGCYGLSFRIVRYERLGVPRTENLSFPPAPAYTLSLV